MVVAHNICPLNKPEGRVLFFGGDLIKREVCSQW